MYVSISEPYQYALSWIGAKLSTTPLNVGIWRNGRRDGLKIHFGQPSKGSSPFIPTTPNFDNHLALWLFFYAVRARCESKGCAGRCGGRAVSPLAVREYIRRHEQVRSGASGGVIAYSNKKIRQLSYFFMRMRFIFFHKFFQQLLCHLVR